MFKKKALSLFVVILLVVFSFLLTGCKSQGIGSVTIEYYSLDSEVVTKSVTVDFDSNTRIYRLVENNFDNVRFEKSIFSKNKGMLFAIEDYVQPEVGGVIDWSTYICIFVDGEYGMYGLMDKNFILTDGMVVSLKAVTSTW